MREVVEHCNRLPVHPRHPYVGELVHTAFSGTHQDAISKGLAHHAKRASEQGLAPEDAPWEVPYLPIDPGDIGRTYEEVIRINSRSDKGGIAHLLHAHHGLDLPKGMRPGLSGAVRRATDASGQEPSHKDLWDPFHTRYIAPAQDGPVTLNSWSTTETGPGEHRFSCVLAVNGQERPYQGTGNGPLSALTQALGSAGIAVGILNYAEHATSVGPGSPAIAYAECQVDGTTFWGAGWNTSILAASVQAVFAAVNRAGQAGR
ncbi:alpha-isopropylmalate synthase regulatory domain-containing protein [Streptomyces sp. NPDC001205]